MRLENYKRVLQSAKKYAFSYTNSQPLLMTTCFKRVIRRGATRFPSDSNGFIQPTRDCRIIQFEKQYFFMENV